MSSNIFCAHWRLGGVLATFGSSLPKFLPEFMNFAGGMRPVSIVIAYQENILPLRENKIGNIHDGQSEQVSVGEDVEEPSKERRTSFGQTNDRLAFELRLCCQSIKSSSRVSLQQQPIPPLH